MEKYLTENQIVIKGVILERTPYDNDTKANFMEEVYDKLYNNTQNEDNKIDPPSDKH